MYYSIEPENRAEFISALRDLADFLAANPAVPVPLNGDVITLHASGYEDGGRAQVDHIARLLGITPEATLADIKKAYRRLARKYHPDRHNGDPAAAAQFREITEAYDTLTDPNRRQAYDRTYRPAPGTKISPPVQDSYVISRL